MKYKNLLPQLIEKYRKIEDISCTYRYVEIVKSQCLVKWLAPTTEQVLLLLLDSTNFRATVNAMLREWLWAEGEPNYLNDLIFNYNNKLY